MPFGLVNAPVGHQGVLIYLDDILIHSRTMKDHLELLEEVLPSRRQDWRLVKCHFAKSQVKNLGLGWEIPGPSTRIACRVNQTSTCHDGISLVFPNWGKRGSIKPVLVKVVRCFTRFSPPVKSVPSIFWDKAAPMPTSLGSVSKMKVETDPTINWSA
eukprot:GHVO01034028.1.p1 GENE.GHVO01034028.1~~GHVO01034028.1.p1  ORF type:complete len:157 (+),score=8.40 GHVO01034028.1:337-807(+)